MSTHLSFQLTVLFFFWMGCHLGFNLPLLFIFDDRFVFNQYSFKKTRIFHSCVHQGLSLGGGFEFGLPRSYQLKRRRSHYLQIWILHPPIFAILSFLARLVRLCMKELPLVSN